MHFFESSFTVFLSVSSTHNFQFFSPCFSFFSCIFWSRNADAFYFSAAGLSIELLRHSNKSKRHSIAACSILQQLTVKEIYHYTVLLNLTIAVVSRAQFACYRIPYHCTVLLNLSVAVVSRAQFACYRIPYHGWFELMIILNADHRGCAMWRKKCLHPIEHWDRGFESHSRYGCLYIFCVCVVLCKYRPCDGLMTSPKSPTGFLQN
jgi:hypothetical protein